MLYDISGAPVPHSEASVLTEVAASGAAVGAARNDSATPAVSGALAQVLGYVQQVHRQAVAVHGIDPVDPARLDSIAVRLARAVGYHEDGGQWRHDSVRNDASSLFDTELIDRSGMLHRPKMRKRVLSQAIPSRSVGAYMERYESRFLGVEGQVTEYKPGTTVIGSAGSRVGAKRRDIRTFVTSVQMDWLAMLQGDQSAVDRAANDAYAVQQLFADFHEDLLVKGLGDESSFWGLGDLPIARLRLTEDYSSTPTMTAIFSDFARLTGALMEAHEDRGDGATALYMGTRLARKLIPANNFSDGGDLTASDLRQKLAGLFDELGIRSFIMTPSLNKWQGSETDDAALLVSFDGERGLHQVSAMAPAPVRSASTLTGEQTMWAMRHGGLDINDATDCAIVTATVA